MKANCWVEGALSPTQIPISSISPPPHPVHLTVPIYSAITRDYYVKPKGWEKVPYSFIMAATYAVIKKTQDQLGKYVQKPPLTEKLLSKPPFRFLHGNNSSIQLFFLEKKHTHFFNCINSRCCYCCDKFSRNISWPLR